ncbi:uncharacterized protein LOC143073756 [Mytilus galloprovincialis]|uniref:uncharacterized protein LOC143073756 n=1 Tax=Mytilus galloprovincialis TaxID=29158 RepID=UPI003F7BEA17
MVKTIMSGSVTDSDACGTDWEKWIPQIDSAKGECNFSWRPPWKNFRIKLCSKDNKVLDNTSGYLVPLKMQFLMTHHLATIQKIIRNLESSTVESINATEELLEIKVSKSLECEDIFTEIDRVLAREIDDIVMKPIQRLEFTSNLVEELFDQELKEKSIDLMRDETNIFIVGFEKMKSFITKNIDEINRITVSKVVKLGDKWKIEAVRCFEIVETLSRTFTDVVVRLQEDSHCVYLKGRDVTISKAEKEIHKLFSDLFNEKLRVDPLILKLLICKEASALFKEVLQKDNLQVVWTVDQSHLYFVSKTKIDTDALKAVVYKTFLTTGFCKSSQYSNQFCDSNVFTKITKQHNDKLLFLETTKTGVNIAGTKSLIFRLLHQENLFYNNVKNTKEIQVDTLSYEVAAIKNEKMKVNLLKRELEVKLAIETQKNKKANDQYESLVRKCKEEEDRFKRIIHEKELLLNESKEKKGNLTNQLTENITEEKILSDTVDDVEQSIKMIKVSNIPTGSSEDSIRFFFENRRKSGGGDIEDLDYDEDSHSAIITFEEEDVVERVISRIPLLFEKLKIDVEVFSPRQPTPDVEEDGHQNQTKDTVEESQQSIKMIKVSNIPPDSSENAIRFFFENKRKSGGGDIEDLDYDEDSHSAIITFEEEDVVERVISRIPLLFEKLKIDVEVFSPRQPTPDVEEDGHQNQTKDTVEESQQSIKMIKVSNIPPDSSENAIRFFFENKRKSGGGDIEDLDYDEDSHSAIITFEEEDVVERVISRIPLLFEKKKIDVEVFSPRQPTPDVEEDGHQNQTKDTVEESQQSIKMIKVSNIPPDSSENAIRFFFENKRKSGGGDIEDLDYDEDSHSAIITFEEEDVVERVISRIPLLFEKKKIDVEVFSPRQPTPDVEEDGHQNQTKDTVEESQQSIKMIKVSNIPPGSSENAIRFFFENKRKSGGGDIEDLDYDEDSHSAIITFEEEDVVERVISRIPLLFEKKKIDVEVFSPRQPTPDVEEDGHQNQTKGGQHPYQSL